MMQYIITIRYELFYSLLHSHINNGVASGSVAAMC
jgi:hypothetical protein